MDEKHEKAGVILRSFWTDHQADRPDGGGCYDEPDAEEIDELFADMREVLNENHDLVLWIKTRELRWKEKAALSEITQRSVYEGMAIAYHNIWQHILFPGQSVQDGTLSSEALARAEMQWTEKVQEELKKNGEVL